MDNNAPSVPPHAIVAAGGIVLGAGLSQGKIAVVRRRRYGREIALPKGKVRKGESVVDAAVREVEEETGYKVWPRKFAGSTTYFVDTVPKIVFYYVMETDGEDRGGPRDTGEIEAVEWLTPRDAVMTLTHDEDRKLISAFFGLNGSDQPWGSSPK